MPNTMPIVLKELRLKQNLKQKDIAKIANISERAYSFYENGKREPSIDTLIELAEFYKVPIDIIVGRYKLNNHSQQQ